MNLFGDEGPFPTVNGVRLTPGAVDIVIDAINHSKDATIMAIQSSLGMTSTSIDEVRRHLLRAARTDGPLPASLISILGERSNACKVLTLFSEATINDLSAVWPITLGKDAAGLALAIDSRKALHPIAAAVFRATEQDLNFSTDYCRDELLKRLRAAFTGLDVVLVASYPGGVPKVLQPDGEVASQPSSDDTRSAGMLTIAGATAEEIESLKKKVASLEQEMQSDRKQNEKERNANNDLWKARLDEERIKSHRIPELEELNRKATQSEQELKTRIIHLENGQEAEVASQVKARLSVVMRPWLADMQLIRGVSEKRKYADLETEFTSLLADQQALDISAGSRLRLRNRLATFEEYQSKIRQIYADSIEPLGGWSDLATRVNREIATLRRIVGNEPEKSGWVDKVIELVHKALDGERLNEVQSLSDNLQDNDLISGKEKRAIDKAIHVAYDRIQVKAQDAPRSAFIPNGWKIRPLIACNLKGTVYLDGYNMLFNLADVYGKYAENGMPGQKARETLMGHVAALSEKCSKIEFHILFDGPVRSIETLRPNVKLEYSGGIGTDRADDAIVAYLTKMEIVKGCFVVTDDGRFRGRVNSLEALYVPLWVWQAILEDMEIIPKFTTQA